MQANAADQPIGFIGLGKMGGPIARRLIDAGHQVMLYDVSTDALQSLANAGGQPARSP
jgi:3-hydroxyisobutyrate dehydrogenase-like beta-hydroxyacid dehydrogenase